MKSFASITKAFKFVRGAPKGKASLSPNCALDSSPRKDAIGASRWLQFFFVFFENVCHDSFICAI